MKLYLATGEAVDIGELVGRDVRVEWQDPAVEREGQAGELPGTECCSTRGRLMGEREGAAGPELGLAAEDVGRDGAWRAATAIPFGIITRIVVLNDGDALYPTRGHG